MHFSRESGSTKEKVTGFLELLLTKRPRSSTARSRVKILVIFSIRRPKSRRVLVPVLTPEGKVGMGLTLTLASVAPTNTTITTTITTTNVNEGYQVVASQHEVNAMLAVAHFHNAYDTDIVSLLPR